MSIRHDPVLVRVLAREIGGRRAGARVQGLHLAWEARAAELRFEKTRSLLFLLHPEEGMILASPPVFAADSPRFRRLFLGEPWAPPDERTLLLPLVDTGGKERHRIAVELHTNQWNLLLLDLIPGQVGKEGKPGLRIRSSLWRRETAHRSLVPGAAYALPPGRRAFLEASPTWEEWRDRLERIPPDERRRAALRGFAWLSSLNVDSVLGSALAEAGREPLRAAYDRYRELRHATDSPADEGPGAAAWLLERRWGPQPYPLSLGESQARPFPSLLAAMQAAAGGRAAVERRAREFARAAPPRAPRAAGRSPEQDDRAEALRLRGALLARRKRLRKRMAALGRERDRRPAAEELRSAGHLLLARLREVPAGADRVTLEDFDGELREIELDPALGPAENAEVFFDQAARRERASRRIPPVLEAIEAELATIEDGLRSLEPTLDQELPPLSAGGAVEPAEGALDKQRLDSLWELAGGRPGRSPATEPAGERLPYLRYRSSSGLEIRVGRNARDNHELTFRHSSPEDIWLHARQVEGAHVILRWGRREENPPRRDLLEAAIAAAAHSGARHSGTVAIDWTRRKYVRKPRKAPPGSVLADRVQTLFVEPDSELLARRKWDG